MDMLSRYIGSLVGGAVGDALGWPIEFTKDADIEKKYGIYGPSEPGVQVTDDTQMTLYGVEGILNAVRSGSFTEDSIIKNMHASYVHWYMGQGGSSVWDGDDAAGANYYPDYNDSGWWDQGSIRNGDVRRQRDENNWGDQNKLRDVKGIKRATSYRKPKAVTPDKLDMFENTYPSNLQDNKLINKSRAPGGTTMTALRRTKTLLAGGSLNALGMAAENDSCGNGTVMRIAPVGMLYPGNWQTAFRVGFRNAKTTHGRVDTQLAAAVQAALISLLVVGTEKYRAVHIVEGHLRAIMTVVTDDKEMKFARSVLGALINARTAKRRKTRVPMAFPIKFWGTDSLQTAVYALLKTDDFKTGLKIAVNNGGDSDTTGAIAGNLLGAYYGYEGVDQEWAAKVELTDVAAKMAADLYVNRLV